MRRTVTARPLLASIALAALLAGGALTLATPVAALADDGSAAADASDRCTFNHPFGFSRRDA